MLALAPALAEAGGHGAAGAVGQQAICRSAIVDMAAAAVGEGGRVVGAAGRVDVQRGHAAGAGRVTGAFERAGAQHQRRRVAVAGGVQRGRVAAAVAHEIDRIDFRNVGGQRRAVERHAVLHGARREGVSVVAGRARDGQGLPVKERLGSGVTVIVKACWTVWLVSSVLWTRTL